jgi:hypothetical protein
MLRMRSAHSCTWGSAVIRFLVYDLPDHILALLIDERDKLTRAIEALGGTLPKRGGRPPKNPATAPAVSATVHTAPATATKRKGWTAAQRRAAAEGPRAVVGEAEKAGG